MIEEKRNGKGLGASKKWKKKKKTKQKVALYEEPWIGSLSFVTIDSQFHWSPGGRGLCLYEKEAKVERVALR